MAVDVDVEGAGKEDEEEGRVVEGFRTVEELVADDGAIEDMEEMVDEVFRGADVEILRYSAAVYVVFHDSVRESVGKEV